MENKSRFVWHDLNARDLEGAKRFYGECFNWKFDPGKNNTDGSYLHIQLGEAMIGGVRKLSANEHTPPSWLSYICVDDVGGTVNTATANGAKVMMPTNKLENVGTLAVLADPTGAVFAPWKGARDEAPLDLNPPAGAFCWDELVTTDPARAATFYPKVFGWTADAMDMGGGEPYTLFNRPGTKHPVRGTVMGAAGMMKAPAGVPHSFWLPYIQVDDTDASCEKAKRLGANVMVPPTNIPNVGRFSCWMDPQQVAIAIISMPK